MNRTTRTVVVMAVATLMAGIASFGVYAAVKSIPVREVEVAHTFVAVAAHNLPTGSRLTEQDVKLVAWPAKNPVPGAFSEVKPIVDRGLVASVSENEPLTETKLAPVGSGAGLPPSIPPGMRAMSVKVDEVIGVAGFVVPGTRVDLVVTLRGSGQAEESMSRTVASNVLVLTAGTRFDQEQAKDGKPQPSTVVTLAVSPTDAERVALASSEGKISLALRNPLDVTPTETAGVHVAALRLGMGSAQRPESTKSQSTSSRRPLASPPSAAPTVVPPSKIYTVEAIRGAKRTEESVR
ncbi:MAG TPA: Flp pilus assembly protein CpaB [Vicinamibacterales bacterium]|jgi:pilus assembly protein CpaB|nr:Flp pilus assembly protein CpaB [Vicinamibacterales bacterium]